MIKKVRGFTGWRFVQINKGSKQVETNKQKVFPSRVYGKIPVCVFETCQIDFLLCFILNFILVLRASADL